MDRTHISDTHFKERKLSHISEHGYVMLYLKDGGIMYFIFVPFWSQKKT